MTLAVEPGLIVFEGQQYVAAEGFLHTHQEVADRAGAVVLAQRVDAHGDVPSLWPPDILTSDKIGKDDVRSWELFMQQQWELRRHGMHHGRPLPPVIGRVSLNSTYSDFSIQPEVPPTRRILFADTPRALASLVTYQLRELQAVRT